MLVLGRCLLRIDKVRRWGIWISCSSCIRVCMQSSEVVDLNIMGKLGGEEWGWVV